MTFSCATTFGESLLATNAPATSEIPGSASLFFPLLRVLGALAVVLAVFFGGLWCFRNWQRLTARKGQAPKLSVLEVKNLGQRHALFVVGYEQQRLLIASSPTGVNLLTALPSGSDAVETAVPVENSFTAALTAALQGKR